jgi:ATP/maltotriose-dependent transcriptional regulator MalT
MSLLTESNPPALTTREGEVLLLIARGHSNKEIARMLDIATGTVEWHVHNVLGKLGVVSRAQAVAQAIHLGYINAENI